jgi:murein DD-endopeptidase MepM/ murein hydrolase activator NlpD
MAAAEEAARTAKEAADAQLAAQQAAYEAVSAQKAEYDRQLQAAQIHLLELQGARNAYQQWVAQQQAAEAAARAEAERAAREAAAAAQAAAGRDNAAGGGGGSPPSTSNYVFPTSGWISSCYGWRWGALHGGVDIAAPVGTPIYAATSGIVARNGFANGFGLALYIRGDDGAVTVYGHVNREYVSAGERVHAGQLIAEVGNRGNSTGPHLHFEVHPSGVLHGGQVNPMPWLRARGVNVGGC